MASLFKLLADSEARAEDAVNGGKPCKAKQYDIYSLHISLPLFGAAINRSAFTYKLHTVLLKQSVRLKSAYRQLLVIHALGYPSNNYIVAHSIADLDEDAVADALAHNSPTEG